MFHTFLFWLLMRIGTLSRQQSTVTCNREAYMTIKLCIMSKVFHTKPVNKYKYECDRGRQWNKIAVVRVIFQHQQERVGSRQSFNDNDSKAIKGEITY